MLRRSFLRILSWVGSVVFTVVLVLSIAIISFLYLAPTFGADPAGEELSRIESSPNYIGGRFSNLV